MEVIGRQMMKTSVLFDKNLLEEIDRLNPFPTRKEFLDHACRGYLQQLRRRRIDEELSAACDEACAEDAVVNKEWEEISLESWK
jgi:metal-responsive CopG/Arc/MetJ family transcriptional regulator